MIFYLAALILGSLLYLGLNWIPIVGPLSAGFIAGRLGRATPNNSFKLGVISGAIGFVTILFMSARWGVFDTIGLGRIFSGLMVWIVVVYNLFGILLTGVGAYVGSVFTSAKRLFRTDGRVYQPFSGLSGSDVRTYRICRECGTSSLEPEAKCANCGSMFSS
ncbi:MAG: hypothetical protein V1921_08950 [Candidatus Altiarchaeota archaeon]